MKGATLVRVAARSIRRNTLRTLLTMLGIIIGVAAVIVMVAVGEGAKHQVEQQIGSLGTNLIVITPGATTQGGVSQGTDGGSRITLDDAQKLREEGFLLAGVSPVLLTRTQVVGGEGNWRSWVFGVHTDYQTIRNWSMESGVFFDEADTRAMRKVVVIGKTVAENLFPGENPVGRELRLRNVPFQIAGVLARKGQNADGADQDDVILAPYTTVQSRLSHRTRIAQILASTLSPDEIPAAQEEIRQILREAHRLGESDPDDFTVRNQSDIAEAAQATTRVMTLLLSAIASISLLVGGIGIMNIMLVSVTERTREIGLRLALGARESDVLTQFLVESVVLCLVGGLIGILVGFGGSTVLGLITGWGVVISPATAMLALLFSGAIGVLFGYYPARRAAALDPIVALRYE